MSYFDGGMHVDKHLMWAIKPDPDRGMQVDKH